MKAEETAKHIVSAFSQDRKRSSNDPWLTVSPIGTDAIEELIAEAIRQAEAAARAEEREAVINALAAKYRDNGLVIAELCDNHLDPSGRLLGIVRERARAEEKG